MNQVSVALGIRLGGRGGRRVGSVSWTTWMLTFARGKIRDWRIVAEEQEITISIRKLLFVYPT